MKATQKAMFTASVLALALVFSALLGSARTAAAQSSANDDKVRAFEDAFNSGDLATAQTLVDPNFTVVPDPRGVRKPGNLAEFFSPPRPQVTPSNFHDVDANTVTVDITLVGGRIPPLPHPFVENDTITFSSGRIVKIAEALSPQTFQDLQALGPPPGMPTTGSVDQGSLLTALILGLLSLAIGVRLRRVQRANSNRA